MKIEVNEYVRTKKGNITKVSSEEFIRIMLENKSIFSCFLIKGFLLKEDKINEVKQSIPTALKNPKALTFTGAVTAEYDGSGAVTVSIPEGASTLRIEKTSSDTTAELDPNKLYIFPEMSSLTYTLATPSDTSIANEYHFVFRSGATATELVHPANVSVPDNFTIEKNKVYEISILEGCLAYQSWVVS